MPWVAGLAIRVLTHERALAGVAHDPDIPSPVPSVTSSARHHTLAGNGQSGQRVLVEALVTLVQRRQLAGITITRALEGSGTHGRLRTAGALELGEDMPVVVEIVDRAERIEALLPEVAALVTTGTLTVGEVRLYVPTTRLLVRDVMRPTAGAISPETPLADALKLLLEGARRMLPVVDGRGVLVGVLTLGHLLELGEHSGAATTAALTLAQPVDARPASEGLRQRLDSLVAGRTVREGMLAQPLTVRPEMPLDAVGRALTQRHLTRAPVVDGGGRLVGLISERVIVEALVGAQEQALRAGDPATGASADSPIDADLDVSALDLRLCVLPGAGEHLTAEALADTETILLPETTGAAETIQACKQARGGLALIIGFDGRLVGVVDEDALLARAFPPGVMSGAPPAGASGLNRLWLRLFARAPGSAQASLLQGPHGRSLVARDLMRPAQPWVTPTTPVVEALALMERDDQRDVACVVGEDGRPRGALWRHDVVRALLGG